MLGIGLFSSSLAPDSLFVYSKGELWCKTVPSIKWNRSTNVHDLCGLIWLMYPCSFYKSLKLYVPFWSPDHFYWITFTPTPWSKTILPPNIPVIIRQIIPTIERMMNKGLFIISIFFRWDLHFQIDNPVKMSVVTIAISWWGGTSCLYVEGKFSAVASPVMKAKIAPPVPINMVIQADCRRFGHFRERRFRTTLSGRKAAGKSVINGWIWRIVLVTAVQKSIRVPPNKRLLD